VGIDREQSASAGVYLSMKAQPFLCLLLLLSFGLSIPAQESRSDLAAQVEADRLAAAACEIEAREQQINQFGRPLPRIAGHCWDGCPTRMVKPNYPEAARRLGLKGRVTVRAIVDEEGKVVFAELVKGNWIFKQAALDAAYFSTYQPKMICDGRKIKFWWRLSFTFKQLRPVQPYSKTVGRTVPFEYVSALYRLATKTRIFHLLALSPIKSTEYNSRHAACDLYFQKSGLACANRPEPDADGGLIK
jgi:TonB family protein